MHPSVQRGVPSAIGPVDLFRQSTQTLVADFLERTAQFDADLSEDGSPAVSTGAWAIPEEFGGTDEDVIELSPKFCNTITEWVTSIQKTFPFDSASGREIIMTGAQVAAADALGLSVQKHLKKFLFGGIPLNPHLLIRQLHALTTLVDMMSFIQEFGSEQLSFHIMGVGFDITTSIDSILKNPRHVGPVRGDTMDILMKLAEKYRAAFVDRRRDLIEGNFDEEPHKNQRLMWFLVLCRMYAIKHTYLMDYCPAYEKLMAKESRMTCRDYVMDVTLQADSDFWIKGDPENGLPPAMPMFSWASRAARTMQDDDDAGHVSTAQRTKIDRSSRLLASIYGTRKDSKTKFIWHKSEKERISKSLTNSGDLVSALGILADDKPSQMTVQQHWGTLCVMHSTWLTTDWHPGAERLMLALWRRFVYLIMLTGATVDDKGTGKQWRMLRDITLWNTKPLVTGSNVAIPRVYYLKEVERIIYTHMQTIEAHWKIRAAIASNVVVTRAIKRILDSENTELVRVLPMGVWDALVSPYVVKSSWAQNRGLVSITHTLSEAKNSSKFVLDRIGDRRAFQLCLLPGEQERQVETKLGLDYNAVVVMGTTRHSDLVVLSHQLLQPGCVHILRTFADWMIFSDDASSAIDASYNVGATSKSIKPAPPSKLLVPLDAYKHVPIAWIWSFYVGLATIHDATDGPSGAMDIVEEMGRKDKVKAFLNSDEPLANLERDFNSLSLDVPDEDMTSSNESASTPVSPQHSPPGFGQKVQPSDSDWLGKLGTRDIPFDRISKWMILQNVHPLSHSPKQTYATSQRKQPMHPCTVSFISEVATKLAEAALSATDASGMRGDNVDFPRIVFIRGEWWVIHGTEFFGKTKSVTTAISWYVARTSFSNPDNRMAVLDDILKTVFKPEVAAFSRVRIMLTR